MLLWYDVRTCILLRIEGTISNENHRYCGHSRFPRSEDRVWRRLRTAFQEIFGADFIIERCLYLPWRGAYEVF